MRAAEQAAKEAQERAFESLSKSEQDKVQAIRQLDEEARAKLAKLQQEIAETQNKSQGRVVFGVCWT